MLVFFSLRVSSNENAGLMLVFRYYNPANRPTNAQRVIVLLNRRNRTKRDFFLCRDAQPRCTSEYCIEYTYTVYGSTRLTV
jgi:hypothetical protein